MLSFNIYVAFAIFSTLVAGVPLPESQYRPSIHHVLEQRAPPEFVKASTESAKKIGNAALIPFMKRTPLEKAVIEIQKRYQKTKLQRLGSAFRKAGKAISRPIHRVGKSFRKTGKAIKKPFQKTPLQKVGDASEKAGKTIKKPFQKTPLQKVGDVFEKAEKTIKKPFKKTPLQKVGGAFERTGKAIKKTFQSRDVTF
ncbi:hypothetical protein HYALB_00007871 [Hymenoscyphus albidus]|uniref:Uncharacterized protein n=1 Tax=Hymenoscyphus albidus TaxID=595503 RepID=A0A9N9PYP4_9HELO|nr:hypothetical protein HYALB_00007871 [Hymenoscyphus albidus]